LLAHYCDALTGSFVTLQQTFRYEIIQMAHRKKVLGEVAT